MFAVPSMANIETDGLSKAQIAQLEARKAQFALSNAQIPKIMLSDLNTPEEISKYTEIGIGIAKSIGAAAKELNVEVNAFAASPVGELVVFLTVYTLFGAEIITMVIGFFFMIPITLWMGHRLCRFIKTKNIIYDPKGKEIGREFYSGHDSKSMHEPIAWITCVTLILTVIQAFTYLP